MNGATKKCQIVTLTDDRREAWDEYSDRHPHGTLFHRRAWLDAVSDAFGHENLSLIAVQGEKTVGVLPLFLVRSRLAGSMLISVPYGVGGGILADDEVAAAELFRAARTAAEERDCSSVELRSERATVSGLASIEGYFGFSKELPLNPGECLQQLPRKARAAARNAREKFGLRVTWDSALLPEVWRLYSMSMRRLGSINYPYSFFDSLARRFPDAHWVSVVHWNRQPVAGLLTFLFRDRVMPYFVGTTEPAARCHAANFLYLTLMERAVEQGFHWFDFGRTRIDNHGSFAFKRLNGFEPRTLEYQRYVVAGRSTPRLSPDSSRYRLPRAIWPFLPLRVTQWLGATLARHLPG